MSDPVTKPSSKRSGTPSAARTEPATEGRSRARTRWSELELSDDDFVLLESSRPAPIPRSVLRAALARGVAADSRRGARPQARPDAKPITNPAVPVPRLPMERDDAPSSWDEDAEVTDECLDAIAAEASQERPSEPFLLVTPLARKRPAHLHETVRRAKPPPLPASARPPTAQAAALLDTDDSDEADTLPVPTRAPCPFVRTTAEASPHVTGRPTAPSAGGGSMAPVALHTVRDRPQCVFSNRPHAVWLLASALAGALGAIAGMQAVGPAVRAPRAASRAVVTNAEPPAPMPARAEADGSAPVDEGDGVEIGPPLPPAGPPPPPRRPVTGSARPPSRPAGGQTARSPRQPRAPVPVVSAKRRPASRQALTRR